MKYTKFAKYVRKLMIDNDENLSDLSKVFDVSISFVSSVFVGKKVIPEKWIDLIVSHYNLDKDQENQLINLYGESKDSLKIDMSTLNNERKQMVVQFQRKLESLSDTDVETLQKIFERK